MANQIESRSADALARAARFYIPSHYLDAHSAIAELAKRAAGYKPDGAVVREWPSTPDMVSAIRAAFPPSSAGGHLDGCLNELARRALANEGEGKPDARPFNSLSRTVADDGQCERADLAAIAEVNGYDLMPSRYSPNDSPEARAECLRGRARVLGCKFEPPLPLAESCAHAVARFRSELEALCARHSVEVEVGHIEPGACVGIRPVADTVVAAMKNMGHDVECGACMSLAFTGSRVVPHTCKQSEAARTLAALDAIEVWRDAAPHGVKRFVEMREVKRERPNHPTIRALNLTEMHGHVELSGAGVHARTMKTKSVRSATRLECLEAAAAWCKKAGS